MMAARRRRAAAGISFGSVTMACASARPHWHARSAGICAHGVAQYVARVFGIAIQIGDDFGQRHRTVLRMPAIVIGDHGHRRVAKLGFARQLGFGDVGHADDLEAQLPMHVRLGQRGKLRPFDAHVGAAAMRLHARRVARRAQHARAAARRWACRSPRGPRCRRRKTWPRAGSVRSKNWSGIMKLQRPQILVQRADRAHRDHPLDAQKLHGVEIGAIVDLRRHKAMAARVPRKERHALAFERAEHQRVRGIAEGRLHAHLARALEARHGVKPAAADDADFGRGGAPLRCASMSSFSCLPLLLLDSCPIYVPRFGRSLRARGRSRSVYYNRLGYDLALAPRAAAPRESPGRGRKAPASLRARFAAATSFSSSSVVMG